MPVNGRIFSVGLFVYDVRIESFKCGVDVRIELKVEVTAFCCFVKYVCFVGVIFGYSYFCT